VEFLSPPSCAGKQIQLYPKSLESKNGPAQGADSSLLTAVKAQFPHAITWRDLGVATPSNSHTTASALAAILEVNVLWLTNWLTRAWKLLNVAAPHICILFLRGRRMNLPMLQTLKVYTRGMQDPKHRGQMLRSPIKTLSRANGNSVRECGDLQRLTETRSADKQLSTGARRRRNGNSSTGEVERWTCHVRAD
jgi:hypothetical protein